MWALGCIAYAMLVGSPPFSGSDASKQTQRGVPLQILREHHISSTAQDLIQQLTHLDRSKRSSAANILDHSWISTNLTSKDLRSFELPPLLHPHRFYPKNELKIRQKLKVVLLVILFIVRIKSKHRIRPGIVRAIPPSKSAFLSRRSSETSSGVSQLEIRNQWLTLDGYAQRVRSENRLDELSPVFRNVTTTSSASGFTGIGISSSVAGQLSEMGEEARDSAEVRPPGPFLAALEAQLEAEAGLSSDENQTEDEDDIIPRVSSKPSVSNPQGAKTYDIENSSKGASSTNMEDEEEEEDTLSPTAARASAVRAWEEMVRDCEEENVE